MFLECPNIGIPGTQFGTEMEWWSGVGSVLAPMWVWCWGVGRSCVSGFWEEAVVEGECGRSGWLGGGSRWFMVWVWRLDVAEVLEV